MMHMVKRIEDLDFYELLNLGLDATRVEIENAYLLAVATYHDEAMASYGVLSAEERETILRRIEEAFETLADPERRKAYDARILPHRPESRQRAYFRQTTERLEIEDAAEERKFWDRVKSSLLPRAPRRKWGRRKGRWNGKDWLALQKDRYYYGEYLKGVREQKGLTLEEIARRSKISLDLLTALEEEDEDNLPQGKDRLRMLQAYARSLGLDSASDSN
jgi:DnaJ-class molecular chaperone